MERSSKHEIVVTSELAHARMELAVVDETARFADYEEREDDPVSISLVTTRWHSNIHLAGSCGNC